jgi:adenine-specific DNA-methyltransferase
MRPSRRTPSGSPGRPSSRGAATAERPPLRVLPTTLWEYPSQHYTKFVNEAGEVVKSKHADVPGAMRGTAMQGSKNYTGATPSWVIWQLLMRYTRAGDTILDPMCGSGTTLDVCADLDRKGVGFDLAPTRDDIAPADARKIPLTKESVDFAFIDPPYSTHVEYSDDPRCIGKLSTAGEDDGVAYYQAMDRVIGELHRVLKPKRYMALYVSDSFKKTKGKPGGTFMPIGVELFAIMAQRFRPVDIIAVVRHNHKLAQGNWRKAAEEGNFFLRGFNYLFIMKKDDGRP